MYIRHLFTKTLREVKGDETATSAKLLIRAGFIHKELAGVYTYLPLGLKVLENIKTIIREELNAIGGQEILMTSLQNPAPWQQTERWDDKVIDVWFKTKLNTGQKLGLGPTHEEPITSLMQKYLTSYKDLPVYAYQFQTKFRNELRAKSGILRTREFLMNDLYSFTPDQESHEIFYQSVETAYQKIFNRLGIGQDTFKTFASGGAFSKYSHEYQTLLPVGEDTIYFNADRSVVINQEVLNDEVLNDLGVKREELQSAKAAEVGNIFTLGSRFSKPLKLEFTDVSGQKRPVFMGCYGIGVSRLIGVITEKFADEKGLVWPETIAPFKYYLIPIGKQAEIIAKQFHDLSPNTILIDDRDLRPGAKFADADLLGIPYRLVISDKTLPNNHIEQKNRQTGLETQLTIDQFKSKL